MATKLATTVAVKIIESQRWIWRIHLFQSNRTSSPHLELCRKISTDPRQDLFQVCKELRPAGLGAAVVPRLIRAEARLLHAQAGPRARRRKRPCHHALQIV